MKKKLGIVLVIIVTILCIYLGINTRKKNGINLTQIATTSNESLSYLIETINNQIIMIDGGNYDDTENLKEILNSKGNHVDAWFITIGHVENFGALQKIIEDGQISIEKIYVSLNTEEWYVQNEPDRAEKTIEFINLLKDEKLGGKVIEIPQDYEFQLDNLYFNVLKIKSPEYAEKEYAGFNQSIVIKIDNNYRSIIFMGNIAQIGAEDFKNNNLDEIECDAVQVSNNGQQKVNDEIYEKTKAKMLLMSTGKNNLNDENYLNELKDKLNAKESYIDTENEKEIKIW